MSASRNGRQRTYEDEVANKRELLTRCGKQWFETTSADFDRGHWDTVLRKELARRGLTPQFIGWEAFTAEFKTIEAVTKQVIGLVLSCIHHAKSNRLTPSAVRARLAEHNRPRVVAFLQVFLPIYEAYEQSLKDRGEVDFEDMVIQSADAFSDGRLQHPYRFILVDEFQDVSNSRAGLLTALLSQSPDIRLFGVGDDWQSIYRFAGADITTMTQFRERFGFSAISHLTRTFRSYQYIADVASQFVMKNPSQLKKTVRSTLLGDETAIEAIFYSNSSSDDVLGFELSQLAEQHRQSSTKAKVFLLGRYNFLEPKGLQSWKTLYGDVLDISFQTIHRSKGLEADVVFILNASNKRGEDFPSTIQDDPLLSLFMPTADKMAWAEERRLFYVALTRARRYPSIGLKTMALYGQISSQIRHILFWAQTRHVSLRRTAVPILAWVFSSSDRERIAWVGQTLPQTLQFGSQAAIRSSSFGVQRPVMPDSQRQGWRVLVTQDFMHSPQRMQVRRNSVSGSAPGGRMSCRLPCRRVNGVWIAIKPKVSPPAREETNPRRERSMRGIFAHPGKRGGIRRSPSAGQIPAHSRHWMHSGERVFSGSSAIAPMGQAFWQAMQRLHSSLTRRLKTPSGEIRLSRAPRGQR